MKRLAVLLVVFTFISACSETEVSTSSDSIYGEYKMVRIEYAGYELATEYLNGILTLTRNSLELHLSDADGDVFLIKSHGIREDLSKGVKIITTQETGEVLELYRSKDLLVTAIKEADSFARLFWELEISYSYK